MSGQFRGQFPVPARTSYTCIHRYIYSGKSSFPRISGRGIRFGSREVSVWMRMQFARLWEVPVISDFIANSYREINVFGGLFHPKVSSQGWAPKVASKSSQARYEIFDCLQSSQAGSEIILAGMISSQSGMLASQPALQACSMFHFVLENLTFTVMLVAYVWWFHHVFQR